jgi:hypothetical protein
VPQVIDGNGNKFRQLFVIHLGDVVDGIHHDESELLTNKSSYQKKIAIRLLQPIRDIADYFGLVMGTDTHDGNEHQNARDIAEAIKVDEFSQRILLRVDENTLIDAVHHGSSKSSAWTSSAANNLGRVLTECATYGMPVPRYAIHAHRHVVDDSGEQNPVCRYLVAPCWQIPTGFAHKVAKRNRADIGGIIINGSREKCEIVRYITDNPRESKPNDGIRPIKRIE